MKKTIIFRPMVTTEDLHKLIVEIKAGLVMGKFAVVQLDIGEPCPKCGGVSVDMGDSWLKQYGRRHRTCIDCMHIWPEASP